jgi:DNA repair ATPase RecN
MKFVSSIVTLLLLSAAEAHNVRGGEDQGEVNARTTVGRAKVQHTYEYDEHDPDMVFSGRDGEDARTAASASSSCYINDAEAASQCVSDNDWADP